MRHKYDTRGIVLSRTPLGEANALITLLTSELGLIRARAQSVRGPGAKLATALTTLTESSLILVRGKEGWRLTGALPEEQWFKRFPDFASRERAARVVGLLLRLVAGEAKNTELFIIMKDFFGALTTVPSEQHDAVEVLVVLRLLGSLGLDTGEGLGDEPAFTPQLLAAITRDRTSFVLRINTGIAASGL